jgi:hypothetical protein
VASSGIWCPTVDEFEGYGKKEIWAVFLFLIISAVIAVYASQSLSLSLSLPLHLSLA